MYTVNDYIREGILKEYTLMDFNLPRTYTEPVRWRCERCGKICYGSLLYVMGENYTVCDCRRRKVAHHGLDSYHAVAEKHGLTYLEAQAPANIGVKVRWQNRYGVVLHLSYDQLTRKFSRKTEALINGKPSQGV